MADEFVAADVARYMLEQLEKRRELYQEDIVFEIERKFGSAFVYDNENGNRAIDKKVLAEFRELTPDTVWERGSRCWRKRQKYDISEKRQQD